MDPQREAALKTQLRLAYDRLNTQYWNNNDEETRRNHFEQVALRHIYATTKIQTLPYRGECFAGETTVPATWGLLLNHLVDPFWIKYQPILWNKWNYNATIYKAALRDYFQTLLQLDGEDKLIKPLLS